ncbi:MAG: ABC transporter permease [SAR202 cluster bacterium]|jgi:peptide/nickel transport system permease protein|nr:ABC transporter permease [SAR202 cluster bacterium]
MQAYILRRLLATIPVFIVVALFVFAILRLTPGDPASVMAGNEATKEQVDLIRARLGLDEPMYIQLWDWVKDLANGDLGTSIRSSSPVLKLITRRIEPSLTLAVVTEFFAILVAVPIGVLAAWKADSLLDRAVMVFASVGFSMPVFWLGFLLIWVFSLWAFGFDNPILPVGGYVSWKDDFFLFLKHLILPAFSLGLVVIALIARMTRAAMLEVLREDYVRTARAKGLSEQMVLVRHALRNASLPIITVIGLSTAFLLSGAVVTESVFFIPGMGRLAVDAIAARDYPVIQGLIIVISAVFVFVNLAVDITYAFLDPRIRY